MRLGPLQASLRDLDALAVADDEQVVAAPNARGRCIEEQALIAEGGEGRHACREADTVVTG